MTAPHTRAALWRLGALVLLLALASAIGYRLGWFDYRHVLVHVERLRRSHNLWVFTIGFVVVLGIGTSVGMPALPFVVAAGALFGTVLGAGVSWVGAMIGAVVGYEVAATIGHDAVMRWLERFDRIDAAIAQSRDFTGMLRLRLIPVIPLGTTNFVGGLARVPMRSYLAATAIGVIPSFAIYTYFADSIVEGVKGGQRHAWISLIVASVLLLGLSLLPKFVNRKQRADRPVSGPSQALGHDSRGA